jgi:hypothetical protein
MGLTYIKKGIKTSGLLANAHHHVVLLLRCNALPRIDILLSLAVLDFLLVRGTPYTVAA